MGRASIGRLAFVSLVVAIFVFLIGPLITIVWAIGLAISGFAAWLLVILCERVFHLCNATGSPDEHHERRLFDRQAILFVVASFINTFLMSRAAVQMEFSMEGWGTALLFVPAFYLLVKGDAIAAFAASAVVALAAWQFIW